MGATPPAQVALALQAAMLSCTRVEKAALAAVRELAALMAFSRVGLALAQGPSLRLVSVSDDSRATDRSPPNAGLLAALAETFDQQAAVLWPEPAPGAGLVPRIVRAHALLAGSGGSAAGVPLVAAGRVIGALSFERRDGRAITAAELQTLEHLACLAGPVLALMESNERALHRRVIDGLRAGLAAKGRSGERLARSTFVALGVAALGLALLPVDLHIGGRARLEGAVQRVLSASADGFVQQVHARPGDLVRAGQALVELADADLLLERQRWQSQLAQQLDAYSAAQARADRSQLVQHQGKADEAQAQLDLVDGKLQRARLSAPFDGIVVQGDLSQQLGAPVKQGAALMTLAPSGRFRVIVEVDERDINHVQVGQTGSVSLTALPWDTLPMRLTRITPVATAVEGRNIFEVEAELLEIPAGLRPGLQGSAQITAGRASSLWGWTRRIVESVRVTSWEWFG